MRDDSIEYQERIERLAQYAGRSKRPSVWEDGKEFPWDNKRGKYIRWTQGPNGPVGEEPSFQAVNPLLAFSQNDIIVGEEAQKEKEKESNPEPKEEPKQEPTPAPEEEPKEEKSEEETKESEEKEYDPSLADVFALNGQHKARYDALCESLDDIDKFQMFAFDTFGESFKPDEIKTLRDAREVIENPDILPDFRGRILIEAYHFAREPHSFTLKKTKPDDLREFLTLMDNSRSFYDTLQTFKWTPWAFTLTPKAKYTSHSREEAIKAVYPYKTIPFLSKEQNVDIRSREKKLLELANAPTTSDAEALYILSQLGEVNSAAKSLLDQYKNFPPADGEDEIFEFRKNNLFIELSAVEEKTKILRERASKPSTPKEEPKEEPKEPPKTEPEIKEEEPIQAEESKATPTTEQEPAPEPNPEPEPELPIPNVTFNLKQINEEMDSSNASIAEKNRLLRGWAKNFFPESEDRDDGVEKTLRETFMSGSVPFYTKKGLLSYITPERHGKPNPEDVNTFGDLDFHYPHNRDPLSDKLQRITSELKANWSELIHTIKRPASWHNTYMSPFVRFLPDSKQKRYATREDAIKNIRGLLAIPSVVTSNEREEIQEYLNFVGSLAAAPTTTDSEACMLLSNVFWAAKNFPRGAGFMNDFKKRFQRQSDLDVLEELADRSPNSIAKRPEWLSKDGDVKKETPKINTARRSLDFSISTASSSQDFLSFADQVRDEIMTPEEAQADREYTAKLVEACNFVAQGGKDKAAEEISAAQEKIESLCKEASSLQSVKDYYDSNVLSRLVAEEIENINDVRSNWGLEPVNSIRAKTIEEEYLLTNDSMPYEKQDGINESLDAVRANLNAAISEEELSEVERIASDIEQTKELKKQIKERSSDLRATADHKGYAYNHAATCAILKKAFPDRGGAPFFPPEWRKETLDNIMEENKELGAVAEQIFDVFDIIGRCFNTGANAVYPPTARFGSAGKGKWGYYSSSDNSIVVDTKKIPKGDLDNIREVLAHELGHWLEDMIKGRAQKNADWLKERTGTLHLTKEAQWERQEKKTPNLTVRPGGYSFRVYKDVSGKGVYATELISTGMEYLVRCATMYASRSPEHFNLLIRNFEEFSV